VKPLAPTTRTAFRELLDCLRDAEATFLEGPRAVPDETGAVDGYRHLTHLLGYAFELYLESDPLRPSFTPLASPTRKILGDNVDSLYHFAAIDGRLSYRIRGVRGNEVYLAFCVYGGKPDGEWSERVVTNVSQRDIAFAPDGGFEIVLSPQPVPGSAATWVPLEADAVCVISREYFEDRRVARPARFSIEVAGTVRPPSPTSDIEFARRLRAVATFLRETTSFAPIPPLPEANVLLPPMPWSPTVRGWGTPDNIYALGQFQLAPGEALVVEGRSPRCTYWGVQLWNRYMQSLEYRYHRVSINGAQARLERDGSFRIVISERDPGHPNWLHTAGRAGGLFFCRWLQADELPPHPSTRVIQL
jgi:hypothetical protein